MFKYSLINPIYTRQQSGFNIQNTFVDKNMNTWNKNLLIIFSLSSLLTACSNQTLVQSVTTDQIVIRGEPKSEQFVTAYRMAQTQCQKSVRNAEYIADYADNLQKISFKCVELPALEDEAETTSEETDGQEN